MNSFLIGTLKMFIMVEFKESQKNIHDIHVNPHA